MASAQDFGPMPGYTDSSYDNDPNMPGGGTNPPGTVAPANVIRVAWLIIILSLLSLWLMGTLLFKRGS